MRSACVLVILSLLAPWPARAEDRTEKIPFRHISVRDAEEALIPSANLAAGGLGARTGRGHLPQGIKVVSVDERVNALVVTGEPAAIRDLSRLTRLLDVPSRVLRFTLRSTRLSLTGPGDAAAGPLAPIMLLDDEGRRRVEAAPASIATTARVSNNRPLHVVLPAAGGGARRLPIIPRVNGDETVTLLFPGWGGTVDPKEPRATLLRRVRAGEWLAIAGDGLTETLVLRVELEPRR